MRPLEMVLLAAIGLYAWWTALTGRARKPVFHAVAIVAIAAAAAAQLLIEGYRWQLVPVYVAGGIVVIISGWDIISPSESAGTRSFGAALWATLGLAAAAFLPTVLPVVQVPGDPNGLVGTVSYFVVDGDRIERYGDRPGSNRELAIQIWYPAATIEGVEKAPFVDDIDSFAPAASEYLGFPTFFLDHLAYLETNSYQAAPAADGRFPVVVYSHGWGAHRSVAINQMEELARQGFAVVAVDHTFAALSTTLSDGEARRLDPTALPSIDDVTEDQYLAATARLSATFAADVLFAIDQLEIIDAGGIPSMSPVAGHLDLARLGLLGHSTGGGAVFTACMTDPRCDGVLGQDPWLEPVPADILMAEVRVPFLAVRSEDWLSRPNDLVVRDVISRAGPNGQLAYIERTLHRDFSALPAISPLATLAGLGGSLGAERTFEVVDAINLAFFDEHLRGGSSLRQRLSGFEEIVYDQ